MPSLIPTECIWLRVEATHAVIAESSTALWCGVHRERRLRPLVATSRSPTCACGLHRRQRPWRQPGTALPPPPFPSVILDARPGEVRYTPHAVRDIEGTAVGSPSTIEPADNSCSRRGSIAICYGNWMKAAGEWRVCGSWRRWYWLSRARSPGRCGRTTPVWSSSTAGATGCRQDLRLMPSGSAEHVLEQPVSQPGHGDGMANSARRDAAATDPARRYLRVVC